MVIDTIAVSSLSLFLSSFPFVNRISGVALNCVLQSRSSSRLRGAAELALSFFLFTSLAVVGDLLFNIEEVSNNNNSELCDV
jgi:hypothetical protein